ncbi:hypothetical protein [Rhodopirellula halodulae]|uniref:hypothetical protein n=1 Tax=Rhodopirellula halodulae TaxID=2894198 RepID=UPI001E6577D3|nr:hypothetical protein [Rhodopirellula sp. JC737]MCC9658827.1 hypothetical protein [Rhodopirellula sp. JC737]
MALVIAALFLAFVWPHIDDFVARPFKKWTSMILTIVCLAPYFLWETIWPPAIDITAYKDSVDYEFRDMDYALDFAALNDNAEWIRFK